MTSKSSATWPPLRQALLAQIADLEAASCRIPGAEDPVSLDEGLRWLEQSVTQGMNVDYRIVPEDGTPVVWLQRWEPDEPRPPWPEDWDELPEDEVPG